MARVLRNAGIAMALLAAISVVAYRAMYRAAQHVRPFYQQALAEDPAQLEMASRALETQAGAWYSDAQQAGQWSAVFSAEQLNGWLAVELATKYAHMLPPDVRDPRIAISPAALSLGFHSEQAGIETVVTVDTEAFLTDSGEVAFRLAAVHAGALPLPAGQIAEQIRQSTAGTALPLRWSQVDGDVVALVDVAAAISTDDEVVRIQTLELHDGEIFFAGETVKPEVPVDRERSISLDEDPPLVDVAPIGN